MQAIKDAAEPKDELQARILLCMSPYAARAKDPSFIQVSYKHRATKITACNKFPSVCSITC